MWKQDTVGDWYFGSELGSGNVFQLENGRWKWEAEFNNLVDKLDMDNWWGYEETVEMAKLRVEEYLER